MDRPVSQKPRAVLSMMKTVMFGANDRATPVMVSSAPNMTMVFFRPNLSENIPRKRLAAIQLATKMEFCRDIRYSLSHTRLNSDITLSGLTSLAKSNLKVTP